MIEVKKAGINDAPLISALGAKSFIDAFGDFFTSEDIGIYVAEKFSLENIKDEISDSQSCFLLGYFSGKPAGYAKLINSALPHLIKDQKAIEMQRLYVLHEYYNKKIGKELMINCLDYAFGKKFNSMWLGVWQKNKRAIEFYNKWGFEIFGTRNFKLGNIFNDDYLMVKKF